MVDVFFSFCNCIRILRHVRFGTRSDGMMDVYRSHPTDPRLLHAFLSVQTTSWMASNTRYTRDRAREQDGQDDSASTIDFRRITLSLLDDDPSVDSRNSTLPSPPDSSQPASRLCPCARPVKQRTGACLRCPPINTASKKGT